jgi:hypothetical protein
LSTPPLTLDEVAEADFVASMPAPVASGWSGCRVGLAPTGKRRLVTAHTQIGPSARERLGDAPLTAKKFVEYARRPEPTHTTVGSFAQLGVHLLDPVQSVGIQTVGSRQRPQDLKRGFKVASGILWIEAG